MKEKKKYSDSAPVILLAEDDQMVRELLVRVLEREGFVVHSAVDGQDALDLFRNIDGEVDMLVTDMLMPRLNGKQLYDALAEIKPELPVLFCSGYSKEFLVRDLHLERTANMLRKPCMPSEFICAVRKILTSSDGSI